MNLLKKKKSVRIKLTGIIPTLLLPCNHIILAYTVDLVNLMIMMTCDRQIKNSSDLSHIDPVKAPLGGVTEDRAAHLPGF